MLRYRPGVALIVVDVQNDFADPEASLAVRGADDVIPVINARSPSPANGAPSSSAPRTGTRRNPALQAGRRHLAGPLRRGHLGRRAASLARRPGGHRDRPQGPNGEDGYSAFTMRDPVGPDVPTMLEPLLQTAGVEEVVIVGLATDYCVKRPPLDAVRLGFATTVLTDGIAAVNVARATASGPSRRCAAAGVTLHPSGCADGLPCPRLRARPRCSSLVAVKLVSSTASSPLRRAGAARPAAHARRGGRPDRGGLVRSSPTSRSSRVDARDEAGRDHTPGPDARRHPRRGHRPDLRGIA